MDILTDSQESSSKEPKQPDCEIALIQLARRIDGLIKFSKNNILAVETVQRLARSVTKSVKPSNTSFCH